MEIRDVIIAGGGATKLARAVGRNHSTILGWDRIPAEHVVKVEAVTGIPRHILRPDVFPAPTPAEHAA